MECSTLLPADQQILDGKPQAMVELNRHCHQAVVEDEGRLGVEEGREPLHHHEEDVLNDDEHWPDIENPH